MKTMGQLLLRANALYLGAATSGLLADVLGIFFAQGPHSRILATARVGAGLWRSARSWRLVAARGAASLRGDNVYESLRLLYHDWSSVMTLIMLTHDCGRASVAQAALVSPSPLAGEGWGEGAGHRICDHCTPSPQPPSHRGRGVPKAYPGTKVPGRKLVAKATSVSHRY
jgi:hypothetical protein